MSNVTIYVATHKPFDYLLKLKDHPIYVPIHCGKAIYNPVEDPQNSYLPELGDDTGDNISAKNPHYCELTAMYWAWKNDKSEPEDIIGFNHYRRYFREPEGNELLEKETIIKWLEEYDFIVDGCGTDYDGTASDDEAVYWGYKQNHIISDLDNALEGTKLLFPDLYDKIEHEVMHSGAMSLCNLFITKRKFFDEYASYLFPVMAYVESKIDFNDGIHDGYNGRVFGFLGERLFRPWLKATGHSGRQGPGLDWTLYSGYIWT